MPKASGGKATFKGGARVRGGSSTSGKTSGKTANSMTKGVGGKKPRRSGAGGVVNK
jgi:hypothetical protein